MKFGKEKKLAEKQAELQRKIAQAEQQLINAAKSPIVRSDSESILLKKQLETTKFSTVKPNSQTPEPKSLRMTSDKRMVAPGSRDAPKFKSDSPEKLRRFIRLMEDLWQEAGVVKDDVKKSMIGKYADEDSEEEWAAFKTYGKGHSWDDFKRELIANYPEAAAAERGTPARIRQLCAETERIRLGDMPAIYAFRRAFMAEARKLLKPPKAMANRELVELFFGCLSESLGSHVLLFLGRKPKAISIEVAAEAVTTADKAAEKDADAEAEAGESATLERRPEDRYDIEDVCDAAIEVSENAQGMLSLVKHTSPSVGERGVLMFNQPVSETKILSEKMDELEGVQALERDRLASSQRSIESRMDGLQDLMKTLLAQSQANFSHGQGDYKSSSGKTHEHNSGPTQKWGKPMESEKCFWCGLLGHFQADCEDLKSQIRSGNVKVNPEGKLRLRDGSYIPNSPAGGTFKERVEHHYSKKPSQYFYGGYEEDDPVSSSMTQFPAQFLHAAEDPERRRARLERELDLREKEDALELKKLELERKEKRLGQASGSARAANVLDVLGHLTEDEIAAIKVARSGFH